MDPAPATEKNIFSSWIFFTKLSKISWPKFCKTICGLSIVSPGVCFCPSISASMSRFLEFYSKVVGVPNFSLLFQNWSGYFHRNFRIWIAIQNNACWHFDWDYIKSTGPGGGLKCQKCTLSQLWRQKSNSKVPAGPRPTEATGEELSFCLFLLQALAGILAWPHCSRLCLCFHAPLCLSLSPLQCVPYKEICHWLWGSLVLVSRPVTEVHLQTPFFQGRQPFPSLRCLGVQFKLIRQIQLPRKHSISSVTFLPSLW